MTDVGPPRHRSIDFLIDFDYMTALSSLAPFIVYINDFYIAGSLQEGTRNPQSIMSPLSYHSSPLWYLISHSSRSLLTFLREHDSTVLLLYKIIIRCRYTGPNPCNSLEESDCLYIKLSHCVQIEAWLHSRRSSLGVINLTDHNTENTEVVRTLCAQVYETNTFSELKNKPPESICQTFRPVTSVSH